MTSVETFVAHLRSVGPRGLSINEVGVFLTGSVPVTRKQRAAVAHFLTWARRRADIDVIDPRSIHVRYAVGAVSPVTAVVPVAPAAPIQTLSYQAVTRIVSGEIGMGSTPGTPVSVAYVSCLDTASGRPPQTVGDAR